MSLVRYAKRKDGNQTEIVDALRAVGARVWIVGQPFDLLVGLRGRLALLECKAHKRLRKDQQHQYAELLDCQREGLPVFKVTSAVEALRAIGL